MVDLFPPLWKLLRTGFFSVSRSALIPPRDNADYKNATVRSYVFPLHAGMVNPPKLQEMMPYSFQ